MAKKSRLDSISVPNPCTESWDEMRGGDKVRFCGICEKNVYNLSAMTAREADKLLFSSGEKVCIRMEKDARGKIKTLKNQLHQITRQAPIAAGVLSATLAFSAATPAQGEPIGINSGKVNIVQTTKEEASKSSISGTICDELGAVIPNVEIKLRNVKTNSVQKSVSNRQGEYQFNDVEPSVYELETDEVVGFKSFTAKNIEVTGKNNLQLNIVLKSIEPTTIGVFADDREIELPPAKVENKLNLIQVEQLPILGRAFSPGLAASGENKQSDKTSRLSLTIVDITDAVIPGAEAILINQKTKQQFSAVSNERGIADFSYIPPGKYQLRVSAINFQIQTVSLKLKKGNATKKKLNLEVGGQLEYSSSTSIRA